MPSTLSRREFLKLAAMAGLSGAAVPLFAGEPDGPRTGQNVPSILVLVFDTLSAPHMSLYGYRRGTTPNIERAAQRAIVYHRHHAGGNFTSPGTATLLTGVYPWSHRALHLQSTVTPGYADRNIFSLAAAQGYFSTAYTHNLLVQTLLHQFRGSISSLMWPRDLTLVSDHLSERYLQNDFTPAFLAEWQAMRNHGSLFLDWLYRLVRYGHKRKVVAEFGERFPRGIPTLHNQYFVLEDAIDWLIAQTATLPRPYLNYVHLLPPHEPYNTRRDFIDVFADGWEPNTKPPHALVNPMGSGGLIRNRRMYDEYLAYVDAEFGRLLAALEAEGSLENTYLVLTSDHGESFERGVRGHVTPLLYEPLIHIPLLVIPPRGRGFEERVDVHTPTSAVDLLPTLAHLMGAPAPDWTAGRPLPHLGGNAEGDPVRPVFAMEAKSNARLAPFSKATVSMVIGERKIVRYLGYPRLEEPYEAYDLSSDPEELDDVYASGRSRVVDLRIELDEHIRKADMPYVRSN